MSRADRLPARTAALAAALLALASCEEAEQAAAPDPIRPVRTVTVETRAEGETVSLTGQVLAATEVAKSFRVGGRMVERAVGVGDRVTAGQVVARLESETLRNEVTSARAALSGARGTVTNARNHYERQRQLLASGFATRAAYDGALQALQVAQAQLDTAQARLDTAQEQFSYADLVADAPGTVLAVGAEPGEVVAAGRMVLRVAQAGEFDAAFDVPERVMRLAPRDPDITVALSSDPSVRAEGWVVEVAPQADPVTRTFRVRVALEEPPPAMRLGSTVTGTMTVPTAAGAEIPASALTSAEGRPAVWVVDPAAGTVALRNVDVLRHDLTRVAVGSGLSPGEVVVSAGVQALRPGQRVRLLGAEGASP